MYPVTTEFQNKIKETTRTFKLLVQIQHSTGTLELTDKDIVGGSIIFNESTQTGDNFTIGGTVASTLEFEIFRKPEHDLITFEGATIIPQVGLLISAGNESLSETYFLNASQPSEFEAESYEYVPLGRFNIDEPIKSRNTIRLKAIDNMVEFDKPYSLSQLSYPANLYQIYTNACSVCDVQPGTVNFPNKDHVVQSRPEGDYNFRDIIGFVAELAGCFAKVNRVGALEIKWYTPTGLTLGPANRFDFKPREDLVQIKGIMATVTDANGEEVTYLTGTDDYAVDLSDNPLLQGNYETVLPNIFNNVKDTIFTPYESRWQGNPALEAGDMLTQIDRDGNTFNTIVTYSSYKYRGASTLSARGLPLRAKGYKGSTNKKIAEIIRKIDKQIGDKLTSLEQAQLNVTELIANMLGGYVVKTDDAIYIADNPDIDIAQKIWKWGIGGFGYSSTGVNGPYTTAISADGTIVAMLVAANIITADMVQTGILSSVDDSTWINLNDGTFNFKEVLKYANGKLEINSPNIVRSDVSYKGTTIGTSEGIQVEFAEGGRAVIGSGGISVQHNDGSHTKIDGRGIMRQFSIPIFEQLPGDADIIEGFESGNVLNTRVDVTSCWKAWYGTTNMGYNFDTSNINSSITCVATDKYSGLYGLKIMADGLPHSETKVMCYFINYRPTKNTDLTLRYKTTQSAGATFGMEIKDMDTVNGATTSITLSPSSVWTTASIPMISNVTYRLGLFAKAIEGDSSYANLFVDDIVFEQDVNEPVIVGYTHSEQPYYDFTYIRKASFASGESQKQIVLPDYFRGLNFDVYLTPPSSWDYYYYAEDEPPSIKILSINNTVPSFTVQCYRYPSNNVVDFLYTVVLNS